MIINVFLLFGFAFRYFFIYWFRKFSLMRKWNFCLN